MCLSYEWFASSAERKKQWDVVGLSINEAERSLEEYDSTCYPVGIEMTEYIFENWTARRVALLCQNSRETLFEVWDKHISIKEKKNLTKENIFSEYRNMF